MRSSRGALVLVLVLVAGACRSSNPAKDRAHEAIAHARGHSEAGLLALDAVITGADWDALDDATRSEVGAAMVELLAEKVAKPFTPDQLDQATRVVTRFQALPKNARDGGARIAMMSALQGWEAAVAAPAQREVRIALLRLALVVAGSEHGAEIGMRLANERLDMARAIETDWPVDALGFLAEEPRASAGVAEATKIVQTIADQPSLLVDAGGDLDAWLLSLRPDDPLRTSIEGQRKLGRDAQAEDTAQDLADDKIAGLAAKRPWDQWLAVRLASAEVGTGKLAAAEARLRAIGAPGKMLRQARFLLGRIVLAEGKLDDADQLLSGLLGSRLQRFLAANAALDSAIAVVRDRLETGMKTGNLPQDLIDKLQHASKDEQRTLISGWFTESLDADPAVKVRRADVLAIGEVVPASILAGTVKLRRAQQLTGADRERMLAAAERTFLAVRTAAEGQPEFHLGLAEIYARLGKVAESDAEMKALLERNDPQLTMSVAQTYRNIGNMQRATEVAKQLYEAPGSPKEIKESVATFLALTANTEEERETWYKRADQNSTAVRTALAELEGRRLLRAGKHAECDAKFAESAAISMKEAGAQNVASYNNAALAVMQRFACTGDLKILGQAEKALDTAYQAASDQPIVVLNLAELLQSNADIRVLAKRVDVKALRLRPSDAGDVLDALLDSPERDAVLADLQADPGWRRSIELYAQYEVLAPSSTQSYMRDLERAVRLRDATLATGTLERMKAAKRLDTSQMVEMMRRFHAGEIDKEMVEDAAGLVAQYTEAVAGPAQGRTRAAAQFLLARALSRDAMFTAKLDEATRAREARSEAIKAWPSLGAGTGLAFTLLDEAGFTAGADRWVKLRRVDGSAAVLATLVADKDPIATAILASPQWRQVGDVLRATTGRPGVDDLRLARLLGDPKVLAWASKAREDKVERALVESRTLALPGDPTAARGVTDLTK